MKGVRRDRPSSLRQPREAAPSESSRRRNMAFMRYGEPRNSVRTANRTREHAKQLAMQLTTDMGSPTGFPSKLSPFADFQSAFTDDPFTSNSQSTQRSALTADESDSASSHFVEEDLFAPAVIQRSMPGQELQQPLGKTTIEGPTDFDLDWPQEESKSMRTMPANSSMQSSFVQRSQPSAPLAPPVSTSTFAHSPSGGAAARRRMRNSMRMQQRGAVQSDSDSMSSQQTPPQSPSSQKRYQRSDSMGSSSQGKTADHVAHYSMTGKSQTSNISVGSANRSTGSSASSSSPNVFDSNHGTAGFTFDAFGLDASQINREVNEAMNDLAGTNPEFSFFIEQDPTDDFAAGRWDSPNVSRTSTPVPPEEKDGFVDGFRVTRPTTLPVHVRQQSPTNTDKSSLTSESSERPEQQQQGVNLFKEQAGFFASRTRRTVVRPSRLDDAGLDQPAAPFRPAERRSLRTSPRVQPARQREVEFYDEEPESEASAPLAKSEASGIAPSDHDVSDHGFSETGAASDFATSSDFAVSSETGNDVSSGAGVPQEVNSSKDRSRLKAAEEEKKEENSPDQNIGSLRARWERPQVVPQVDPATNRTEDRPVTPVGPQLLKERKAVVDVNGHRANECVEQRTSFASVRERLKSSSLPRSGERESSAAKSEGGAAVTKSQVSSILSRLERESPRDSKSDVGEPSPSYFPVKLRKTGFSRDDASPPNSAAGGDQAQSPAVTKASPEAHGEAQQSPQPVPVQERKLTYRERRELELQKQREEEEKQKGQEQAEQSGKKDVASLIRKRIAANKNHSPTAAAHASQPDSGPSGEQPIAAFRQRLRPVSIDTSRQGPQETLQTAPTGANEGPAPVAAGTSPKSYTPNSAVSRLIRLQQQSPESKESPQASSSPKKILQPPVQPPSSYAQGSSQETTGYHAEEATPTSVSKAATPKATKMMLNAFLAGRGSLGSTADGAATVRTESSAADHRSSGANDTTAAAPSAQGPPPLNKDPKYEKYFKMLKLGMPLDVVKHAMVRDGLDPDVMDGDHNMPAGIPLKDDPRYSKYFRMLKVGMPMDAVKHSMERDGLDSHVMDHDHNLPAQTSTANDEPKDTDSHRRARLHWKTLRKVTSNSLWAQIDQDVDLANIEIDEEEFQELFQVEKSAEPAPKATGQGEGMRNVVRVIDPKRANNGGIILARLKVSHDEMADAVDRVNENYMTAEQIENLIEYLPTKEERKALEAYMLEGGQDAAEKFQGLCECEKFMVSMMTVKHAKRKVRALLFKLQFESCVLDIQKDAALVEAACDELSNSTRLRQLMGIVLTFGNRLNTAGNGKRKAGAFTLDSLLKLNQAKAFDKKTTFLNYVVLIVRRNNELLLNFKDDLPSIFKADRVFWDQCVSDLEDVETQLENVRKVALHLARQAQAYRLRRRNDEEESLGDADASLSLEEEVEALRSTPTGVFTLHAIKYVSALRDLVEGTKVKFARLLEYFGEEEGSMQPHELFSTIVRFCRDFDKGKEHVFAEEKRKLREERKRAASSTGMGRPPNGKPPTHSPAPAERTLLRASSHQPSFSSIKPRSPPPQPTTAPSPGRGPTQSPVRELNSTYAAEHTRSNQASTPVTPQRHNNTKTSPYRSATRTPEPEARATPSHPELLGSPSMSHGQIEASSHKPQHMETERVEHSRPHHLVPAQRLEHVPTYATQEQQSTNYVPTRSEPTPPAQPQPPPSPSQPRSSAASLAMRHKARMRRRAGGGGSLGMNTSFDGDDAEAPAAPAAPESAPNSYSRPTSESEEGANNTRPSLAARASIRTKRRVELMKKRPSYGVQQ